MRYFKDTRSVKRFAAAIINDFEAGRLDERKFKALVRGAELLLKCFIQLYYEEKLGTLPDIINTLREEIEAVKEDKSYYNRGDDE